MFSVLDASKTAVDGKRLWSGVNLELTAGQICAVTGVSGTGKSTFLRAIGGLDPLESGTLALEGQSYQEVGGTYWRRYVSYSPQRLANNLGFTNTPYELAESVANLAIVDVKELPSEAQALAEQWNIDAETFSKEWSHLSGGEKARSTA